MSYKTYLWIEDRKGKASYTFWQILMQQLCPDVIVESKKNNSELVKAVKALTDKYNKYIIIFDNSFDNVQLYKEQKILKTSVDNRDNVFMLNLICFEFTLLEFDKIISWIYASDDEFLTKRSDAIRARKQLIEALSSGDLNYKTLQEVTEYDANIDNHNIEQLSAKLLFDLTRNTGFEVTKGVIGDCWIKSCCDWLGKHSDDICGLENTRLSIADKMKLIYVGTSLEQEFSKVGLEVSL